MSVDRHQLYDLIDECRSRDRYQQASDWEHAVAEYWASMDGNELTRVTRQTADGGKDFVGTSNGDLVHGEVKYWERPVDWSVVRDYLETAEANDADLVFSAPDGGLTEPATEKAKEKGIQVITGDDLPAPWYKRVAKKAIGTAKKVKQAVSRGVKKTVSIAKTIARVVWKYGVKKPRVWWKGLPLWGKIVVAVVVVATLIGVFMYGRKKYRESDAESIREWLFGGLGFSSFTPRFSSSMPGV